MKNKPIVHAFFVCYNEANILPHLLRYYSTFCEKITIMDNNSTDNSVEIIESFPNTDVIPFESNGEFHDGVHIKLKNNVWKSSVGYADYVILGDSDEFLWHENMVDFLIKSKEKGVTFFKPEGYHMVGDESLELNANDNILEMVKYGVRTPVLDKPMMFDCNQIVDINYGFGCHSANPTGNVVLSNDPSLKMLHYKFLGLKDYLHKNHIRAERLSGFNKQNGFGLYYMYSDEEHTIDYANYKNKSVKVID
jgi:glycosyltransferase involved in cell wall biosynthesis